VPKAGADTHFSSHFRFFRSILRIFGTESSSKDGALILGAEVVSTCQKYAPLIAHMHQSRGS
jgi:hypothetical protein